MQRLKEKDAQIDAGIDAISRTIDNLSSISNAMKDEVCFCLYVLFWVCGLFSRAARC